MTIGEEDLLKKHGTRLKVAEAFLKGEISSFEEPYAIRLISKTTLEAAKMRIDWEREDQGKAQVTPSE